MTPKDRLDALIAFVQQNNRVCPMPPKWNSMYDLLVSASVDMNRQKPKLPLILGGWWHTSVEAKRDRLIEHLRFAEIAGTLDAVEAYLTGLSETDWFHEGD